MKISFILTGEGSSDLRLVEHIETIFICEGFAEASGEAPDLSVLGGGVGRTVREKLTVLLKFYPNVDVIFVHRDADNAGADVREQEIWAGVEGVVAAERIIPIIPVTMLETWLLADHDAIKRVAGNSGHVGALQAIPAMRQLEGIVDAKSVLLDALCEASEVEGRRLQKFKKRFFDMRARLTLDLDPGGPVQNLPSYARFRSKVSAFSNARLEPPVEEV
ncbi:hypothetical protein [Paraburkholderia megapolitana]|uniref:hypothetical protein n=1 Tax=Paraburkholderia megapolitana TaxID=420953 RepID=UPI000B85EA70|nr:hypothetical protein [Paraburkholderia megapolitana]QDQ82663.1 hypothetical protein FNZ07_15505 [Paraburkholderia megapolitana]